ncbi:MAG: glycosyltransferase, partial [Anaerolineae bacterium]
DLGLEDIVALPGPLPREALLDLYPRATVFAAPCIIGADGNRDGLPTVLIEAMAMGVPVVSTPVTGIPELVRHEDTGLLVPEGEPAALAAALARQIEDPETAAAMARSGRGLVERHFDLVRNVGQLRRLLVREKGS